jgi:hypothetical protein
MVHSKKKNNRKRRKNQGFRKDRCRARKIEASTSYGFTDEQLTPYGGLLGLVKLWDGLKFEERLEKLFCAPRRTPILGHGIMIKGLLLMLFIGFCRIGHFVYIDEDPMVLGILNLKKLPVVSTFWRYLKSLAINQANSLLGLNGELLGEAWVGLQRKLKSIHIDIDTTVETVYGDIQGARVGHNPRNRGKKGLRPVLAFIAETKEYIGGRLRRGKLSAARRPKNSLSKSDGLSPRA